MNTYRAMAVIEPGKLGLVKKTIPRLKNDEVLLKVEACGMCGADINDIANASLEEQRVPGHEIIGSIISMGPNVPAIWKLGQRVGVGRFGGYCQWCDACRQGNFHLCANRPVMGITKDGGYAEIVCVSATGLVAIPEQLSSFEAAPILCAGIATNNALKMANLEPGDSVAILGIGGLGHMAIQYAKKRGFHVTALGRGEDIAQDAYELGAHQYIDLTQDSSPILEKLQPFKAIISTIGSAASLTQLSNKLDKKGKLIVLGITKDKLEITTGSLVSNELQILGSITGTPYENEQLLKASVLNSIRPQFELIKFENANQGLERLKSGQAKFRLILRMGSGYGEYSY